MTKDQSGSAGPAPDPGGSQPVPPTGLGDQLALDRREAIRRVSILLGGAVLIGESALWTSCSGHSVSDVKQIGTFTAGDIGFLDEVAETILPTTRTPGAKAAGVGTFMARTVTDCYEAADQEVFRSGMRQLEDACQKATGTTFMSATSPARLALLQSLDREQKAYMAAKQPDEANHYFRLMKELALLGYFTSEIGCTQAQRYVESPGRYDPCTPYAPGAPAWAAHA